MRTKIQTENVAHSQSVLSLPFLLWNTQSRVYLAWGYQSAKVTANSSKLFHLCNFPSTRLCGNWEPRPGKAQNRVLKQCMSFLGNSQEAIVRWKWGLGVGAAAEGLVLSGSSSVAEEDHEGAESSRLGLPYLEDLGETSFQLSQGGGQCHFEWRTLILSSWFSPGT